jgi:hypothetical protein
MLAASADKAPAHLIHPQKELDMIITIGYNIPHEEGGAERVEKEEQIHARSACQSPWYLPGDRSSLGNGGAEDTAFPPLGSGKPGKTQGEKEVRPFDYKSNTLVLTL